jgi:integration host factor subunit alpha
MSMKIRSRENTHKKNIIKNLSYNVGIPSSLSKKLVDDIISIIIFNVIIKKNLKINNFGSFSLKKKKERIGRNPMNKTNYVITERNVLTFKAATILNRKINKDVKR